MTQSLQDFIAFDVETAGTNFREDQIIEICVIRVRGGVVTAVLNTMVQPTKDLIARGGLDPKVTEITGYTLNDMYGGINEADLANLLTVLLRPDGEERALLIAYNAEFDLSFVDTLFVKYGFDPINNNFIDPLTIARDRSKYPHKLADMCKKMGIEMGEAHTAYADTLALVDVYLAMLDEDAQGKWRNRPVAWYKNKLGYKRKFGEPEWLPDYAETYPQGAAPDVNHANQRAVPKVRPTYTPVVVNNADKRKKRPDFKAMDNTEFAKEFMPSGFLKNYPALAQVKTLIEDPFSTFNRDMFSEVVVTDIQTDITEFNMIMHYLTKEIGLRDSEVESHLAHPNEAVIGFRRRSRSHLDDDPFANSKGPIEISEDDLPF